MDGSNAAFLEKALAKHKVYLTEAEKISLIGVNNRFRLTEFLKRAPEAFLAERRQLGNTCENRHIQPMPGLIPFLTWLRADGIHTAVVSSTSTYLIDAALKRMAMTDLFDIVICGDMVQRRKPDPEPYRKAMQYLKAKPEECVIFEDSPVGIRAGKAAGSCVVAYCGSEIVQDTHEADCQLLSFWDYHKLPFLKSALTPGGRYSEYLDVLSNRRSPECANQPALSRENRNGVLTNAPS